jgi:2-polyprenyl-6-methoxyphenol hydroxylase-like FAD-dependent oxidoreductase
MGEAMLKALVIGCGRVGSAVALQLQQEGWDVTVVD